MRLWAILVLGIAANLDNLGIGLAYGLKKIKVPLASNLSIAILSGIATLLSAFLGHRLSNILPAKTGPALGGIIVSIIGVWTIAQYFLAEQASHHHPAHNNREKAKITWQNLWKVFENPALVDKDQSNVISVNESLLLGIALSINCLTTGLGAGMTRLNTYALALSIIIFSLLSIQTGMYIARRYAATHLGKHANLLTGIILIIIGLCEIFF